MVDLYLSSGLDQVMRYFGFECYYFVLVTHNIIIVRASNETVKIKKFRSEWFYGRYHRLTYTHGKKLRNTLRPNFMFIEIPITCSLAIFGFWLLTFESIIYLQLELREKSNRKAMNRNWSNQKANPALKTKAGNK